MRSVQQKIDGCYQPCMLRTTAMHYNGPGTKIRDFVYCTAWSTSESMSFSSINWGSMHKTTHCRSRCADYLPFRYRYTLLLLKLSSAAQMSVSYCTLSDLTLVTLNFLYALYTELTDQPICTLNSSNDAVWAKDVRHLYLKAYFQFVSKHMVLDCKVKTARREVTFSVCQEQSIRFLMCD